MNDDSAFVTNSVWKDKLEKVAAEAAPSKTDYKQVFRQMDPEGVNVVGIMDSMGISTSGKLNTEETGKAESIETISSYLAHAGRISNIISVTHNPPVSPARKKIKKLFLKTVCWPSRRYLYPQIQYNNDIVSANQELLLLVARMNKDQKEQSMKMQKTIDAMNQEIADLRSQIEKLTAGKASPEAQDS